MKRHSHKEPEHPFDNLDIEFDHKAEDKGYTRYKHRCYRNLILKSLLAFVLGLFLAALLRFLVSHTPRRLYMDNVSTGIAVDEQYSHGNAPIFDFCCRQ